MNFHELDYYYIIMEFNETKIIWTNANAQFLYKLLRDIFSFRENSTIHQVFRYKREGKKMCFDWNEIFTSKSYDQLIRIFIKNL